MWILNNTYFHFLSATVLAFAVYMLGLSGGFYFDDEWNILRNQALQVDSFDLNGLWQAALSGTSGPFGRPLAMLSFALNHVFFGLDPYYFKIVNLFIHLMCGWTIYVLVILLSPHFPGMPVHNRRLFAFLVLLLWLLHPLNLTTVLYSVQRMTGLSALFCLLGMLAYVKARQLGRNKWKLRLSLFVCSFIVFWPLALASKENAALFPVFLFILELVFLRFRTSDQGEISKPLVFSYLGFLAIPSIAVLVYFLIFPEWIVNGYSVRDFSLHERLMTEPRILLFYLGQIFLPSNSALGLFHDDIALSTSLISPWTTLPASLAVIFSSMWALAQVRKRPVMSFGILFFLAAHSLESSVFALELAHEHRNYLATFPVLMAIAYYLLIGTLFTPRVRAVLSVCVIVFFGATTTIRAATWGTPVLHSVSELTNHPLSPRSNYSMGKLYAIYASSLEPSVQKNDALTTAKQYFLTSAELRESYTDGLFGLLMMDALEGFGMDNLAFEKLLSRLASEPFASNNYNYLHSMFDCLIKGDCQIDRLRVTAIIEACLENSQFSGQHRTAVLKRYETYLR